MLYFVVGLEPRWFIAWVAPIPLLLAAFRASAAETWLLCIVAGGAGFAGNFDYYTKTSGTFGSDPDRSFASVRVVNGGTFHAIGRVAHESLAHYFRVADRLGRARHAGFNVLTARHNWKPRLYANGCVAAYPDRIDHGRGWHRFFV